jgi:predicted transcriptional regulator
MERYNLASKTISNYTLKSLDIFQQTSLKFKLELSKEVLDIGGTPIEYSKVVNSSKVLVYA